MNLEVEATYSNGVLKLDTPLPLSDEERVRVLVRTTQTPIPTPDTDLSLTVEQMAEVFRQLGSSVGDDEPLTVDPDDSPLT